MLNRIIVILAFSSLCTIPLYAIKSLAELAALEAVKHKTIQDIIAGSHQENANKANPEYIATNIATLECYNSDGTTLNDYDKYMLICAVIISPDLKLRRQERIYCAAQYALLLYSNKKFVLIDKLVQLIYNNKDLSITKRITHYAKNFDQYNLPQVTNFDSDSDIIEFLTNVEEPNKYIIVIPYFIKSSTLIQANCCRAIKQNNFLNFLQVYRLIPTYNSNTWTLSAIHTAASHAPDTRYLRLLIEAHANIEAVDNEGDTPLIAASRSHLAELSVEAIKLLLQEKQLRAEKKFNAADVAAEIKKYVNHQNSRKLTACVYLAANGYIECLKLLIEANADINLTDSRGHTALMAAVTKNQTDTVRLLIEHKANINTMVSESGYTALTFAQRQQNTEIIELLRAHADQAEHADNQDN